MISLYESDIEQALIEHIQKLGYSYVPGPEISPDGERPERETYEDVILWSRVEDAIKKLNSDAPEQAISQALRLLRNVEGADLAEKNRTMHNYLTIGIEVTAQVKGEEKGLRIKVIAEKPEENDLLVTNQFTIIEKNVNKRPDVLIFVNGLPLVVIELKNPDDEHATVKNAFNQLQTYKRIIPSLFITNTLLVAADGYDALAGSLTAGWDRFSAWKSKDGTELAPKTEPQLTTLTDGLLNPATLLDMHRYFMTFERLKTEDAKTKQIHIELVKKMAAYHQYYAVNKAVLSAQQAASENGDRKAGVVWHTQGSGKSLSMVFFAAKLVQSLDNPTIVVITDRNDLDDQLFETFTEAKNVLRQPPIQAESRTHLQKLLQVSSGGIVFTTIQKFFPESKGETFDELSNRKNIIVIADEAHRTQYGFKAKTNVNEKEGSTRITYGFAKYLRDALPNASFIGFTGTPVEKDDANTPAVFGDYIDVYDIQRAVIDGATVQIYYESRLAKVRLNPEAIAKIDEQVDELLEDTDVGIAEAAKAKWAQLEAIVGEPDRLKMIAEDLVNHFEERSARLAGKTMMVCMSRRIAAALYEEIEKLRPDWHDNDFKQGVIKVVMTSNNSDSEQMQRHNTHKSDRKALALRMKDPDDPLKLVIVVDMWLTGFDAPCLHTMYIDKPMRGHNLMQAIARVNRVFKDKTGGLVVDYIGIATELKKALRAYTEGGGEGEPTFDISIAVRMLKEKLEVTKQLFHGFDYERYFKASTQEKLGIILEAQEHILGIDNGKDRFLKAVDALSKTHALCAAETYAREVAAEVGFFEVVRTRLRKFASGGRTSSGIDIETAIRQIIDEAVVAEGVVDIFDAAGIKRPDISILSEEFLEEVRTMKHHNLALELLKKLLSDEIKIRSKCNFVQSKKLSERLQMAIQKYQNNLLTSVEVIEELMNIAREIRMDDDRAEAMGLTEEEIAFYDALIINKTAIEVLGDKILGELAHEIVDQVKKNISVDWTVRENAKAKLRVIVKRLLKKYGYPPDIEQMAVDRVLKQSELLAKEWASDR
ncbi:MAG: type I restriction endonuclease subunit R [Candidatus Peribacteraceae bacterium]|nr:type I restriction endonuclease subunit R [Candidatus Peribacteraceae bacterium]